MCLLAQWFEWSDSSHLYEDLVVDCHRVEDFGIVMSVRIFCTSLLG